MRRSLLFAPRRARQNRAVLIHLAIRGYWIGLIGLKSTFPDGIRDRDVIVFDFRPRAIIDQLDLLRPIYCSTTNYGHFGKPGLPWER